MFVKPRLTAPRYHVDVVGMDPSNGKVVEMHQVGRQTQGGLPVSRERQALGDIHQFHPYNN